MIKIRHIMIGCHLRDKSDPYAILNERQADIGGK
jgi:hypothetical protein